MSDFQSRVASQDFAGARELTVRASQLLGEDTLSVLRMRAFLALQEGQTAEAGRLYRNVLERVPDDREASLNLAILEWQRGDAEAARARLLRLRTAHPGDAEINRYLSSLERR